MGRRKKPQGTKNEVIRAFFDYEPTTGEIWWREWVSPSWYLRKSNHDHFIQNFAGKPVVFRETKRGYFKIGVAGIDTIYAHQIAWTLTHGESINNCIDHIDGNRQNNAIDNLRDVPQKINCRNQRMRTTNSSGFVGVHWNKSRKKWCSTVTVDAKRKDLGGFDRLQEAVNARRKFISENPHLGFSERHGQDPQDLDFEAIVNSMENTSFTYKVYADGCLKASTRVFSEALREFRKWTLQLNAALPNMGNTVEIKILL